MSRRITLAFLAVPLAIALWCAGAAIFGPQYADRAAGALRGAGVAIGRVDEAPVIDKATVSDHRVFTTADGRVGHILIAARAPDGAAAAAALAQQYLAGRTYVAQNTGGSGRVLILLDKDRWSQADYDRIAAAIRPLD